MTKVAIIGTGPCGLSMLRAFQQAEEKGETIPEIACFETNFNSLFGKNIVANKIDISVINSKAGKILRALLK